MKIDIKKFDLNLLIIFDTLMVERNVSKAAERVFLSQSAMSHALKRLRDLLDDPILIKTNKGMVPTPRALTMEIPIKEALDKIQRNLYSPEPFNALESDKTFVVYNTEYFECVVLPILMDKFAKTAPKIRIISETLAGEIPESELMSGEVSVIVGLGNYLEVPKRLYSQPFLEDSISCLVRKDNLNVGEAISLKQFTEIRHLHQSALGLPFKVTFLDEWLRKNKISRTYAAITSGYLSAAMILAETDHMMTAPSRLARKLVDKLNLRIVCPPEGFPKYKLNLIWHPLYEKDSFHIWFREQLLDVANRLNEEVETE